MTGQGRGAAAGAGRAAYGVVVLTQGTRPADLRRGLESLLAQRDADLDVLVVGNGWEPAGLPDGVRGLALPQNTGIPAGRNAGVPHVRGDLLFFLDDDASLPEPDVLSRVATLLRSRPEIGMVQPRVLDPAGRAAPRRWTPRLRVGDPAAPGPAMNVWEGAVVVRRAAFEQAGGWPEEFWYAHEGIDLAWRVWDGGWVVWYAGDIQVHHPVVAPTRHAVFHRYQARNRVWLARRNLPAPLAVTYVGAWAVVGGLRLRSAAALRETLRGYKLGLTTGGGPRRPMSWRTVWRMTRAGRPPVL